MDPGGRGGRGRVACGSSCTTATTCCATSPATTLIPLLIFDQFEEIFTLAQSDDFGRARAARFIDELADLVENRPPKALEAQARGGRAGGRALRLRAQRLPRADRAARGLPRAARGPEERDAEHHAEPPAARADDRRAGARGGAAARQGPGHRGSRRRDRALRRRRRRDRQRRGRALAAEPDLPRAERRAHRAGARARSRSTCSPARTPPSSATSTSARSPTSRPPCAASSRTSC